jgi:hypothetical protein
MACSPPPPSPADDDDDGATAVPRVRRAPAAVPGTGLWILIDILIGRPPPPWPMRAGGASGFDAAAVAAAAAGGGDVFYEYSCGDSASAADYRRDRRCLSG